LQLDIFSFSDFFMCFFAQVSYDLPI